MAVSATLHCLLGCSIGEVTGLIVGTGFSLSNTVTVSISIGLAFVFGYLLSLLPLLRSGMPLSSAYKIVLASDTLSILTMEIVDNIVMLLIPGAMNAGLMNPLFWITMPISLLFAFWAAVPVNYYLLRRGISHHGHH